MNFKFAGTLACVAISLTISGCNGEYANTNTNVNTANVNATTNTNANANTNTAGRQGPTREDYERDKDRYQREAKEAGRTIGTGINDGWLWVKTRFELAGADDLRDSTINVDVDNNVVTLTGTVASAAQRTRAAEIANAVEGVTSVKNMLKVSAANTNAATK